MGSVSIGGRPDSPWRHHVGRFSRARWAPLSGRSLLSSPRPPPRGHSAGVHPPRGRLIFAWGSCAAPVRAANRRQGCVSHATAVLNFPTTPSSVTSAAPNSVLPRIEQTLLVYSIPMKAPPQPFLPCNRRCVYWSLGLIQPRERGCCHPRRLHNGVPPVADNRILSNGISRNPR